MKQETGINYTRQFKAVWRFKWLIIIAMIVAGAISLVISLNRPTVYHATTTLMIETIQSDFSLPFNLGFSNEQDFSSQIAVMRSKSVLERAINQLEPERSDDPVYVESEIEALQGALDIVQVYGTDLLSITVFSNSPEKAEAQANAVAEAYIHEASLGRTEALNEAVEYATEQIKKLSSSEVDITTSPSFPKFNVQLKNTLTALERVSSYLTQMQVMENVVNAVSVADINKLINTETDRIDRISDLVGQMSHEIDFADIIDNQVNILALQIQSIKTKLDTLMQTDTDPTVLTELQSSVSLINQAADRIGNIPRQLETMARILEREESVITDEDWDLIEEIRATMIQELKTADISLDIVQNMMPNTSKITLQKIDIMHKTVSSAISTLRQLSEKTNVVVADQEILVTYAELAELEIQVKLVATNVLSLYQQTKQLRQTETDTQISQSLVNIEELLFLANSSGTDLPNILGGFAEGGPNYDALTNLQQEIQLALLTNNGDEINVVEAAAVTNPDTSLLNRYGNVGLAMFAVLLLGILGAMVFQYFDRKVRDFAQVENLFDIPLLAQISPSTTIRNPSVLFKSERGLLEDFRTLRTNLGLDEARGYVLLVSSPEEGEGKTMIAANLARVVALQERKVLLIDGNLRNPDVSLAFGGEYSNGLVEFLKDSKELQSYITQADGIDILAVGTSIDDSAELLSSPRMKILIEDARQVYDVIIIDGNPVLPYADAMILARMVNEVLLVLTQDVSRINLIEESVRSMQSLGVNVSGFILNKMSTENKKLRQL